MARRNVLFALLHSFTLSQNNCQESGKTNAQYRIGHGMQIVQDILNGQPVRKAAKSRAKAVGKSFLTGALQDITQQGRGRKALKRKRKAVPVSLRQTKKRRTSTVKFRTIFD